MSVYLKKIIEEEDALKKLESEWEYMTKEYYESLKCETEQEEIDRIQMSYFQREMEYEKAQLNHIYTIHRIKACMIKEDVMEN